MLLFFLLILLLALAWGLADSQLSAPIERTAQPVVAAKAAPAPPPVTAPPAEDPPPAQYPPPTQDAPPAEDAPANAADENPKKGLPGEPSENQ
jgi:hypothetical protein